MTRLRSIALIPLLLLTAAAPLAATVTFSPAQPVPGQMIVFSLNPDHPNLVIDQQITWDFGDGASIQTESGVRTASHSYAQGGTYTVSVSYFYVNPIGGPPLAAEIRGRSFTGHVTHSVLVRHAAL